MYASLYSKEQEPGDLVVARGMFLLLKMQLSAKLCYSVGLAMDVIKSSLFLECFLKLFASYYSKYMQVYITDS